MTEEAFQRLIRKTDDQQRIGHLIADALGKILIVRNIGSTVEVQDFGEYYRAEMQNVLKGETVENNDLQLLNGEKRRFPSAFPCGTRTGTSPAAF
jgi:hypothetical protein